MLRCYINVACVGNVNEVLASLCTQIEESGLYEALEKCVLVCNGGISELKTPQGDKWEVIHANPGISKCEFPTLELLWEDAMKTPEDYKILYLHTKGVTKPGNVNISDWREYLAHFNISQWRDRIEELNIFDCVGVNLQGDPKDFESSPSEWGYTKTPLHYSGNFWWCHADHVRKLPNPVTMPPDQDYFRWRMCCEMWVCQLERGTYWEAWTSGVNHYHQKYPKSLYT